jgi:urease accessory protein UreE
MWSAISSRSFLSAWFRLCFKAQAAAEPIVEVRHKDPDQLMRLGWHLGNRHLPETRFSAFGPTT